MKSTARVLIALLAISAAAACRDGGGIVVRSLVFEGVHQLPEADLRLALTTATSAKVPWTPKTYFSRQDFDADLQRIESFYASHGFPDARVTSYRAHYNEDKSAIDLTVRIDEGAPVTIESVEFVGFEPLPADHLRVMRARTRLPIGAPRDQERVEVARGNMLDELRDHGFPKATVTLSERPGSTPRGLIVTFTAVPGPYATFGAIKFSGNTSVGDDVMNRQITVKPGQEFRLTSLERSQRRLYSLELFQFVNVEVGDLVTVDTGGAPRTEITTKVTVVEAPHRQITFGVGYGSEDHARVDLKLTHVNFFGGARVASAEGKFSSLERGVRLSFNEPAFGGGTSLGLSGESWYSSTPAYTLRTTGGRIGVLKNLSRDREFRSLRARGSVSITFAREYESYRVSPAALADNGFRPTLLALGLNPATGEGTGTVSAMTIDVQRNTVANPLDARRGVLLSAHAETAAKIAGGDFSYRELSGEARGYLSAGRSIVLAGRVHGGFIGAPGDPDTSVPFFKRYFLGGATSLRGWGRFEVAPLTKEGLPIGGYSMGESSGEVRWAPGSRALDLVGFVDAGNVWNRSWRIYLNDLRADAGVGLRYRTPIGPIRMDLAFQLTPNGALVIKNGAPGQYRQFRFHFSIGQAF